MKGHEGKEYGYDRLMEAVLYKPHTVPALIGIEPWLLNCKNYSGETVMHWFVVENNLEIVELLHKCGGRVDWYALSEACSLGHVRMIRFLLEIGVIPDISSCQRELCSPYVSRSALVKIKRAFHDFGYEL